MILKPTKLVRRLSEPRSVQVSSVLLLARQKCELKIHDWEKENQTLSTYTVPKATDDFIVNNEKKKHSSYGMKSFIP
jgi:hypothetical protein